MKIGIKKNKLKSYTNAKLLEEKIRAFILTPLTEIATTKKSVPTDIFSKFMILIKSSPEKYFIKFQSELTHTIYNSILALPLHTDFSSEITSICSMTKDVDTQHHKEPWEQLANWQAYLVYHNGRRTLIESSICSRNEHALIGRDDIAERTISKLNALTLKSLNAHTASIKINIEKVLKHIPSIRDDKSLSNYLKFHMEILYHLGKNLPFASIHGNIIFNHMDYQYWDIMLGKSNQHVFVPIFFAYNNSLDTFYRHVEKQINQYAGSIKLEMARMPLVLTKALLTTLEFNLFQYQSLLDSYARITPTNRWVNIRNFSNLENKNEILAENNVQNEASRLLEILARKIALQTNCHIKEYNAISPTFLSTLDALSHLELMFKNQEYRGKIAILNESLSNISKCAIAKNKYLLREIATTPSNQLVEKVKNALAFNKSLLDKGIKIESPFNIMSDIFYKLTIRCDVEAFAMNEIKVLFSDFNKTAAHEMDIKIYPLITLLHDTTSAELNLGLIANANTQNSQALCPAQETMIRYILSNRKDFTSINFAGINPQEPFVNYLAENKIKVLVRSDAILNTDLLDDQIVVRPSNSNMLVLENRPNSSWCCIPRVVRNTSATQNRMTHVFEQKTVQEPQRGMSNFNQYFRLRCFK